jgi:hypothetical protein
MNKCLILMGLLLVSQSLFGQTHVFEFGLGVKYDHFKVKQTEDVFDNNFDMGAMAYVSYGRPINEKLNWQVGLSTNNYKLNFKVLGPEGIIYSGRELVSVMRSNRLYLNLEHTTKQISPKLTWVNGAGISLLIGTKNPYDVILQRGTEISTPNGPQSIQINIQTYGKTGSAIMIGAGTKLYYQVNKDFRIFTHLGFITSTGELTKVEVNYVEGSSSNYKKAIFTTNGFAPYFNFGVQYLYKVK